MSAPDTIIDEQASESLAVAPPTPGGGAEGDDEAVVTRDAHDASDHARLRRDPSDEDAKLDIALDESFPGSDAPSNTQPGKGKDPAPSSGYDAEAEAERIR